jgi:hypothetical protein
MLFASYAEIRALLAEQRPLFEQRLRDLGGRVPAEARDMDIPEPDGCR